MAPDEFQQKQGDPSASADPQVPGKSAPSAPRPPGEIGGHTVQPWEQDPAAGMQGKPTSKDVPPPQAGAAEAKAAGPGPGMVTTQAPGNIPSSQGLPGGTASAANAGPADAGAAAAAEAATPERSASLDDAHAVPPAATRPARPPVYSPQKGHEPAPRPPPSHQPGGAGTDGDRLVEAISRAIAENLGKAFHQSVAQAVREVFPLSAKTVDTGMPATNGKNAGALGAVAAGGARPAFTQASTAAGTAGGNVPPQPAKGQVTPNKAGGGRPAGKEPQAAAVPPKAAEPTPAAAPPSAGAGAGGAGEAVAPDGRTGPTTSQYGGTIEPPVPAPSDPSPPGNAAAASADEESRKGRLA